MEMTSKCLNFAVRPLAYGSWLQLSFDHSDVISMVDKRVQTMETCFQFVFVKIIKN